jgi:hypothetical protein
MASMHGDFFQGQIDRSLFYWPNHSGKLGCPINKKKKRHQTWPRYVHACGCAQRCVRFARKIARGNATSEIQNILEMQRMFFSE